MFFLLILLGVAGRPVQPPNCPNLSRRFVRGRSAGQCSNLLRVIRLPKVLTIISNIWLVFYFVWLGVDPE